MIVIHELVPWNWVILEPGLQPAMLRMISLVGARRPRNDGIHGLVVNVFFRRRGAIPTLPSSLLNKRTVI
jgi:hypothetical protein